MRKLLFFLAVSFIAPIACANEAPRPSGGPSDSYAAVVQQFFPQNLRDGSDLAHIGFKPGQLESAYVATDFNGSSDSDEGRKYIVAAYSNAWDGAVRVLQRSGQVWSVAAAIKISDVVYRPSVTLRDVDGDGIPEIVVQYKVHGGSGTWMYRWRNGSIQSLWDSSIVSKSNSVVEDDSGGADVTDFVDLDGDGKMEAILRTRSWKEEEDDDGTVHRVPIALFAAAHLKNGVYEDWKEFVTYDEPKPGVEGKDEPYKSSFEVTDTASRYVMRIVKSGEKWTIRSADIRLNGAPVVDPSAWKQKNPILVVVGLLPANTLVVQNVIADGKDSIDDPAHLTITIEKQ